MSPPLHFSANGKLLLTGEYAVLHGALALAMPCRYGQQLSVSLLENAGGAAADTSEAGVLHWRSLDHEGQVWMEGQWRMADLQPVPDASAFGPNGAVERLTRLLQTCREANPTFLADGPSLQAETHLDFPRDWGLGSSSTLVHLLSQWAEVDPYTLQFAVFGGSGYDIACAGADGPIYYKLVDGKPVSQPLAFDPPFADRLGFVHLGQKRDSREAMADARENLERAMTGDQADAWRNTLVHVTMAIQHAQSLEDFAMHLRKHEDVVGRIIGQIPIQHTDFADFEGVIKSLGGWGGDYVLTVPNWPEAASEPAEQVLERMRTYFAGRGLSTFMPWHEMILQRHG